MFRANLTPSKSYKIFDIKIDEATISFYLNMQNDLAAIRELFANKALMHKLLAHLEKQLVQFVGDLYDPVTRTLSSDYMNRKTVKECHRHLLGRYCENWAKSRGFKGVIKINEILSREDFTSMLLTQSLFKDNAFKGEKGNGHTALGHFWQWWCITEYAAINPSWISCPPAELYRKMGENKAFDWDNTFEFYLDPIRMIFINSYSKIETFGGFLLSDESAQQFPVLHQLIARSEKRIKGTNSETSDLKQNIISDMRMT